jgi:hypothetical protein
MKKIAAIGLTIFLAACGGDGDDSAPVTPTTPLPAATAEGFWEGSASTGVEVALAVLENGETWGVYTSNGTLVGALYGNTTSSGTTLTGSGKDFNIPSRTVSSASYSGTFSSKSTIKVSTSAGSSFSGSYNAAYDQPASLAALAGTFSGWGVSGTSAVQGISATISSAGAITVPTSLGCAATGTAKPRASGKNVFDVTVTFVGASCALGNGTSTQGIAYYDTASREVLVMSMNSAKSDGFIFVGKK